MDVKQVTDTATELANSSDMDVLFYNGDLERPFDDALLDLIHGYARRKNVLLFLCTRGGNPDAAYRMARSLQQNYEKFVVGICGRCKSAGTLIAIGAHQLIMTAYAEMGPLDIQFGKKDELFEMDSGLTVLNALQELEEKAFDFFERGFIRLKLKSEGRITLKTATAFASDLTVGILAPIVSQIDPLHVGEVSRGMRIGEEYGKRLSAVSKNLTPTALNKLINDYPSHTFVIDKKEAKDLFVNVRDPSKSETVLIEMLGQLVRNPDKSPALFYLSKPKQEKQNEGDNETGSGTPENSGGTSDGAVAPAGERPKEEVVENLTIPARRGKSTSSR